MILRMDEQARLVARPQLTATVRSQGRLQTWIASLINRDKTYVTHVMKGRRTISYSDARILSAALGQDVSALFDSADAIEISGTENAA